MTRVRGRTLFLGAVLTIAVVVPSAGIASPDDAPEQPGSRSGGALSVGLDEFLLATIREIAGEVAQLRGQPFDRPPIAIRAPDTMRRVAGEIRGLSVVDASRLQARGRAWQDLGFATDDTPSRLYRMLAADIRDIGFDAAGNRLLVAPDRLTVADFIPSPGDEGPSTVLLMTGVREDAPIVAHLLMHVRQRERRGGDWFAPTTDELLASAAWAESEANLVALRYLFRGMGLDFVTAREGLAPDAFLGGRLVPEQGLERLDTLGHLLRFVYVDGFEAAAQLLARQGWNGLDEAMASRTTTSDVLHLDRVRERSPGTSVPEPPRPGLALADEDRLGEFATFVLVSKWTGKDSLGLQAADGWVEDRLRRWEPVGDGSSGRGVTEWVSTWGSEQDASEFAQAAIRTWSGRFPGATAVETEAGGREFSVEGRVHRIVRSGNEIRIRIEPGADDRAAGAGGR